MRPPRHLRPGYLRHRHLRYLAGLLALLTAGLAATPVPHPPEVRRGAAVAADVVAWVPGVQVVTGAVGEVVAVDLALDDGTAHPLQARLSVHAVEVDRTEGPVLGDPSDVLTLATDQVTVGAGDRVALRATATVPDRAVLAAVRAELVDAAEPTRPATFVLLGPEVPDDVEVAVSLDGDRAVVTVTNAAPAPTVVDLAVRSTAWAGRTVERRITNVLVDAESARDLVLDVGGGAGRRQVVAAVAPRGGATVTADAAAWGTGSVPALVAVVLLALATLALLRVRRRREGDPR